MRLPSQLVPKNVIKNGLLHTGS